MYKDDMNIMRWPCLSALMLILLVCAYPTQAFSAPAAADWQSKSIQARQAWSVDVPADNPGFLQVQNDGFDTITRALDADGNVINQSASWRGREGRYLVALTDGEGNRAARVEIRNLGNDASGQVRISWNPLNSSSSALGDGSGYRGLYAMAVAGGLHVSHAVASDQHQQAADLYLQALDSLSESDAQFWSAAIHFELAVIYRHMGSLNDAKLSIESALNAYQIKNDSRGVAAAHNTHGLILAELGAYVEAVEQYQAALQIRSAEGSRNYQAHAYNNMALAYAQIDEYSKAIQAYQKAIPLYAGYEDLSVDQILGLNTQLLSGSGDLLQISTALNNLALAKSSLGEVEQAEALFQHAIELAQAANNPEGLALAKLNQGKMYQQHGRLESALSYLGDAADYYRQTNNGYWLSEALTGVGNVYASISEYQEAVGYYRQAQALGGENQQLQSNILRLLANANWRLGETDQAGSQFNQAQAGFADSHQITKAAVVSSEYGMFLYEQGQHDAALQNQRAALRVLTEYGNVLQAARAESRLGRLLLAEGQNDEAEQHLQSALEGHRAVSDDLYELDTLTALSRVQTGVAALDTAKVATQLADSIRTRTNISDIQTSFLASRRGAFEQYINLLVDAGEIELAWSVNEQIRARTLLDLIQGSGHSEDDLTAAGLAVEVPALQQQLHNDAAMLSYFLGEQRSHLWVISNATVDHYPLPAAAEINLAATGLTEVLRSHRQSPSRIAYVAEQLSEMVLHPAAEAIAGRELIVVADGGLQLIPFGLLPVNSDQPADARLIAQTNVTYTPSARVYNLLNQHPASSSKDILVLADPLADNSMDSGDAFALAGIDFTNVVAQRSLSQTGINLSRLPGAQLEAQAIAGSAELAEENNRIKVLTGAQANHGFVMSGQLNRYGVLHFATHGVVDADAPELSGLVLAKEPETHAMNYLRPHEIASLDLDADLVVLSGCETGIGKSVGSEGLYSLSRPFLIAGARQVISSLWQVSDRATAELMERFYFHLLEENQTPEVALRNAQQWMSAQPQWHHPYFWAGFVVQGGRSKAAAENQYVQAADLKSPPLTLVSAAL